MKSERDVLLLLEFSYCSKSQNLLAISVGRIESIAFQGRGTTGQNHTVCVSDKLGIWHFDTFEWKMMVFVQEKLNMAVSSIVKRWLDFYPAELRNFTDWHDTSLGKLTPILMRSAASTIFRRIILNVCGGGPPVKWERK